MVAAWVEDATANMRPTKNEVFFIVGFALLETAIFLNRKLDDFQEKSGPKDDVKGLNVEPLKRQKKGVREFCEFGESNRRKQRKRR
jgi:hypothetical protein